MARNINILAQLFLKPLQNPLELESIEEKISGEKWKSIRSKLAFHVRTLGN